jgi:hypothetical protein
VRSDGTELLSSLIADKTEKEHYYAVENHTISVKHLQCSKKDMQQIL